MYANYFDYLAMIVKKSNNIIELIIMESEGYQAIL